MPTNKKEGIIFTTLMCGLMVLGMSVYNLVLHNDLTLHALAKGFIPGFLVAFVLDVFVVGTLAKGIVFRFLPESAPTYQKILSISTLMILGMVTCMSLFGVLIEGGIPQSFGTVYRHTWLMNVIVALPYQLMIVGPISRFVLTRWVQQPISSSID